MNPWIPILAAIGGMLVGWWFRGADDRPAEPQYEIPAVIPHSRATLCMDCTMVTESHNDHCNYCGAPGYCLINLGSELARR